MANGLGGNMFSGFLAKPMGLSNAIGQGIGALGQAQQQKQERHRELQAADLLQQSLQTAQSDPEGSQAAFIQAMQMAPDFVNNVLGGLKTQQAGQAKPMSEYQSESLRLRELEYQQKELDRALKEETNDLRRQQIQTQIDKNQQAIDTKKKEAEQKEESIVAEKENTAELVSRMLNHSGLESAVGGSSILPTRPGSKAADFEALFDTLKGKQFLNAVQQMRGSGSLSDAEGKKIAAAAESLELSMSEDAFRDALKRILDGLRSAKSPGTYSTSEPEGTESVIKWDEL